MPMRVQLFLTACRRSVSSISRRLVRYRRDFGKPALQAARSAMMSSKIGRDFEAVAFGNATDEQPVAE
jgi:hypothetical protein